MESSLEGVCTVGEFIVVVLWRVECGKLLRLAIGKQLEVGNGSFIKERLDLDWWRDADGLFLVGLRRWQFGTESIMTAVMVGPRVVLDTSHENIPSRQLVVQ